MKEYRIRLNSGKVLGPEDENKIKKIIHDEGCDGNEEVQEFPMGDWEKISESEVFKGQIKDKQEVAHEDFKEFEFTHEDPFEGANTEPEPEIEEKTRIIKREILNQSVFDEKTKINIQTKEYLEELKKEALQKQEEILKQQEVQSDLENNKDPDYNNDKTEVITLETFRNEAKAIKKIEAELREEERNEIIKKRKQSLDEIELEEHIEAESKVQENEGKKKDKNKKKIYYIIGAIILIYMLFAEEDDKNKKPKRLSFVEPKITFPVRFDIEDAKKAKLLYRDGLILLKKESYIAMIKASEKFRQSAENKFKDNNAVARLIYSYSHLLDNVDNFGREANTVFKLVQIFKHKELENPYFASAISYFYLKAGKVDASVKIVERYLALKDNQPTAELFNIYLLALLEQKTLDKAKKIAQRLLKEKDRDYLSYRAILKYHKMQYETQKYIEVLDEASEKYPKSVYFSLLRGDLYLENNNFKDLKKVLQTVGASSAGRSKIYYAHYLRLKGMYFIYNKKIKEGILSFKKSLKLNESNELTVALAELKDSSGVSGELISQSKAKKKIQESKRAYAEGRDKIALNLALEAASEAPDFLPARIHMAKLQVDRGYLEDAMIQLNSLYKQYRSSTDVLYALIDVYIRSYKFNDAKKLLNTASSMSSLNDDRHASATAKYFLYRGDLNRASGWLQKSINSNPLNDENVYELARLYIKYYKFGKAKFYLKKAMELDPANINYKISFAEILYEVESSQSAITYLLNILDDYPNNPDLLSSVGIYYYRSGQIKKYQRIKSKLIEVSQEGASLYKFLIESAKLEENYDMLIDNSYKYLEIKPGDSEIRLFLAQILIEKEKYKDAFKQLKEIKSRLSSYPRLQFFFAKLYLLNGDVIQAKELAEKEIKENPEVVDGYLLLGDIYKKEKDLNLAQKYYLQANQRDPRNIESILGLAFVAFSVDQYDMALDQYQKAIEIDPNRPLLYKMLGDAYRKLGQSQLAIKNYKHFLEVSPKNSYKEQIQTYINTMQ